MHDLVLRLLRPSASCLLAASAFGATAATTPAALVHEYAARAGAPADPARGQAFFTADHGREWRCATCHGAVPSRVGRHAATGREIRPLAPALEPARFTDAAHVEKWFRRNCRDVLGRECSAQEKADVIAWLTTIKP